MIFLFSPSVDRAACANSQSPSPTMSSSRQYRLPLPRSVGIRSEKQPRKSLTYPTTCWRRRLGPGRKMSNPSGPAGPNWNQIRLAYSLTRLPLVSYSRPVRPSSQL
jgi:hypothetical protein